MNSLEFSVPLLPPSVNHYRQPKRGGGFYTVAEVMGFVEAVCVFSKRVPIQAFAYEVEITFYLPPDKFMRLSSNDLDNFLKVSIDALARAGVISNDGRILDLLIHKRRAEFERDARTDYKIIGKDLSECAPTSSPLNTSKSSPIPKS